MAKINVNRILRFVAVSVAAVISIGSLAQSYKPLGLQADEPLSGNACWVNPFIGTGICDAPTRWGNYGGTYPGAVVPWGMVQLTPETSVLPEQRGYYYHDDTILYFSCLNHISGFPDGSHGDLVVMFYRESDANQGRKFIHEDEIAEPGYYSVKFADGDRVEAVAAHHSGMFRYSTKAKNTIIKIADKTLSMVDDTTVMCKNRNAVLRFQRAFDDSEIVGDTLTLQFADTQEIIVELCCSATSITAAMRNGAAELCNGDFDAVRRNALRQWNEELAVVDVETTNTDDKTKFYTALYHSMLMPRNVADVGDPAHYAGFSPWDTFQSLHPLMTLLKPKRQQAMLRSLMDGYAHRGMLHGDSMTGHHVLAILLDSYVKGACDIAIDSLYAAAKTSYERYLVDNRLLQFEAQGYVDAREAESVTLTADLAYDHWVMAQLARLAGKEADAQRWERHTRNFINLWDAETGFLLPRLGEEFYRRSGELGYKESTRWTASWFAPHSVTDLVNLHGGGQLFAQRLQKTFDEGNMPFDNELVVHYPLLFTWACRSDLAMRYTRQVMSEGYRNTPGGIPGNDDLGAMSSWWALAAMGIVPVCPGSGEYVLVPTVFDKVTLHLASGSDVAISRKGSENEHAMPVVRLDGKTLDGWSICHRELLAASELQFDWTAEASKPHRLPYSMTTASPQISIAVGGQSRYTVNPDEEIRVPFVATNHGALGSEMITVSADGKTLAQRLITVPAGGTVNDTISFALYATADVRIASENLRVKVRKQPAKLQCSGIDMPSLVRQGSEVQAVITVKNAGGEASQAQVPIELDGENAGIVACNLAPGEELRFVQHFTLPTAGFVTLKVLGKEHRIKVYDAAVNATLLDVSFGANGAHDKSGFGNQGIGYGPLAWGDGYVQTTDDAYVEFQPSPSLSQTTDAITMVAWIKPLKRARGYADFFSKGDCNMLKLQHGDELAFFAGGWGRGACAVKLPDDWYGAWHMVAGVGTQEELRLYVDGKLAQCVATNGAMLSTEAPWNLGRNAEMPFSRFSDMQIGAVRIYGAALTAADIQQLFTAEQPQP